MTKTFIITGAARGIGKACALELARRGGAVAAVDLAPSTETAVEIGQLGGKCEIIEGDVADPATHERAVARALERFGRVDGVVANAAWSHRCPFVEMPAELAKKTVDVTMWGVFHAFQAVARRLLEQGGGGSMVAIGSVHFARPFALSTAYNMAKAGVNHLVMTVAAELAPHRVRVNIVEPGWTDTPGERMHFTEEQIAAGAAEMPFGRLAQPEEIAKGVAWLCSEEAGYVSGATLRIDGALVLPRPIFS
ncbi:MAG: SDR family oxidoreductase [Bryobacteraceae bacterium]